jgi:hypothetical protein
MTDPSEFESAPVVDRVVEAKVTAASSVTLLFAVLAAVLIALQDDPTILFGLPPWLQFVLVASVPPLATFAAGYAKTSNRT